MTTQLATRKEKTDRFYAVVKQRLELFKANAPRGYDAGRMLEMAGVLAGMDEKLADAKPISVVRSLMTCAKVGLLPDDRAAHLAVFAGECQVIFGFRGLMELALRHDDVVDILAPVTVYEEDEFSYTEGQYPTLTHAPAMMPPKARGEVIAHYAVAIKASGERVFAVVWNEETLDLKTKMLAGKRKPERSPWSTHYIAMCWKTAMKALCKWLPQTDALTRAIVADDASDAGIEQNVVAEIDLGEAVAAPQAGPPKKSLDDFAEPPIDVNPPAKKKTKAKVPEHPPQVEDDEIPAWVQEGKAEPDEPDPEPSPSSEPKVEPVKASEEDPTKHEMWVKKAKGLAMKLPNTVRSTVLEKFDLRLVGDIKRVERWDALKELGEALSEAVEATGK